MKRTIFSPLFTLAIFTATIATPACDEASPSADDAPAVGMCGDEVDFRGLPPEALYISQYKLPPGVKEFIDIVMSCDGVDDKFQTAITWSQYQPDNTWETSRVMGLGFSAVVSLKQAECYKNAMLKRGAEPL